MGVIMLGLLIILAMVAHSSGTWCVCKGGLSDTVLQKTLDYACGAGADCNPIKINGQCCSPNTVRNHCSYAVNSYFQKKGGSGATCDFGGTAMISTTDPSSMGCAYPASSGTSASGTSTTSPVTTVPTMSPKTPTSTPVFGTGIGTNPTIGNSPTTKSPYTTSPNTDTTLGGAGAGFEPSGMDDDSSQGRTKLEGSILLALLSLGILFLRNQGTMYA